MNIKEYQERICKYCIVENCTQKIEETKLDDVLCMKCLEYNKGESHEKKLYSWLYNERLQERAIL